MLKSIIPSSADPKLLCVWTNILEKNTGLSRLILLSQTEAQVPGSLLQLAVCLDILVLPWVKVKPDSIKRKQGSMTNHFACRVLAAPG
ncbi:Uncharacterized protein TCM_021851 [Theobroma cacao]|uniref:Uncharacterized protein n=1 Tax=Theobroma cacao TaxID=3641 RepID=A0A061EQR4_THECC|nr:Uncharacterized protein TCM_021851 [Theobroma cacao]